MTAQNAAAGLPVDVVPSDIISRSGGPASFTRVYDNGTQVTLTAPKTSGFNVFQKWQEDGVDWNSNRTTAVLLNANAAVTAIYGPPIVAGQVLTPALKPVSAVSVAISGDTNWVAGSGVDGSFGATLFATGNFVATPTKLADVPPAAGVTTLDIAVARRHILNITPFDSPYKFLAADVDASKDVNTLDLAYIRRLVLGNTNTFPAGLWRFVPADYVFPDPQSPWDAPSNRLYAALSANALGQDFIALKVGDVDNSWPAAFPGSTASVAKTRLERGPVRFEVSSHAAKPHEVVKVKVSVGGFTEVTTAQFTLGWDPAVLRFLGIADFGLDSLSAGNFGMDTCGDGRLAFSWDNPAGIGVRMTDGATLLTVNFEIVGAPGSVSALELVDRPTLREVTAELRSVGFEGVAGQLSVMPVQPWLSAALDASGKVVLSFPSSSGVNYVLQFRNSLSQGEWRDLTSIIGNGTTQSIPDPEATNQQRFYRLRGE